MYSRRSLCTILFFWKLHPKVYLITKHLSISKINSLTLLFLTQEIFYMKTSSLGSQKQFYYKIICVPSREIKMNSEYFSNFNSSAYLNFYSWNGFILLGYFIRWIHNLSCRWPKNTFILFLIYCIWNSVFLWYTYLCNT